MGGVGVAWSSFLPHHNLKTMGGVGVAWSSFLPHHNLKTMGGVGVAWSSFLPHHNLPTSIAYHITRRPPYLIIRAPASFGHSRRLILSTRTFTAHPQSSPAAADDDEASFTHLAHSQKPLDIPPDSTTSTASFDLSRSVLPELKANTIDHQMPLSLRMIKHKKKKQQQLLLLDGSSNPTACPSSSSVKRAFSSMVFIFRELQSYTLQLLRENLHQGTLARVQGEMHASFVWLFQHIFACTPTLMLSLMLLLANFTAHSMAMSPPDHSVVATVSTSAPTDDISFLVRTSALDSGRTASMGGGGGPKARPVAGAADDGRPMFLIPKPVSTADDDDAAAKVETRLWEEIMDEARRMEAAGRDEALMQPDILQRLVSPVTVEIDKEEESYLKTELMYHQALSLEPHSVLFLTNFAQFLYLVLHDHDRAEIYFKRAVTAMPVDAEAVSQYASFLWGARRDLGAAEDAYLEAIAADPGNAYHAASYANFLWSTGGEDTCYPLSPMDMHE